MQFHRSTGVQRAFSGDGVPVLAQAFSRGAPAIHRPPLEREDVCAVHGGFVALCHLGNVWTSCPMCSSAAREQEAAQDARKDKDRRDAEWQQQLGRAGIPERFLACSFGSYVVEHELQQQALDAAMAYAKDWAQVRAVGRGAFFLGNVGTGKTHLAVSIGVHVMRKHGASVLFMSVQRAIRSIKDTWARGSATTEAQAVAVLTYPDLLILDEVGVQFGSDYERQVMFDVLNERYERRKPTLFLSNKTIDEVRAVLGERVMDRLREDGATVVPFGWASARGSLAR
jgi:DNA replication protein DnaC